MTEDDKFLHLKHRLPEIRTLAMLKMEKNFIALEKGYQRQPYKGAQHTRFLIQRIKDETKELEDALDSHHILMMLEELADISNIIDYLFEQVTDFLWNQEEITKNELTN